MALHAVPAGIDPEAVEKMLNELPGVTRIHDLHIWPMSTTEAALTAHLVMPDGHPATHSSSSCNTGWRTTSGSTIRPCR
jgi:Co/Zn/Cd efflux system component